ncbi:sulfotransferase [Thermodesulfobacteriota bacterium]
MTTVKIKLLYIGGYSRSGSTILSNVLGEIDGFFNAGELMFIWDRLISEEGICGCGVHVRDCNIWSRVLDNAFEDTEKPEYPKMIQMRNDNWQSGNVIRWRLSSKAKADLVSRLGYYLDNLEKLYWAAGTMISDDVIIDSSKNPTYLYLLSLIEGIELHVVHIVRDPRATAYSWLSKKQGFTSIPPWRSSVSWDAKNMAMEVLKGQFNEKYIQVRYEDFIANPKNSLRTILEVLGEEQRSLNFITDDGITFKRNHCVYGNPDLFKKGRVKLLLDDRWKSMTVFDKLLATGLTWPFIYRYGYHRALSS